MTFGAEHPVIEVLPIICRNAFRKPMASVHNRKLRIQQMFNLKNPFNDGYN
jgi:hypothetical protein